MFGKNKKTKKQKTDNQPTVHTMQDDLNINLNEISDDSIGSSNNSFPDKNIIEDNKKETNKKNDNSNESVDLDNKPEINLNPSSNIKESPFISTPSPDPVEATLNREAKVNATSARNLDSKKRETFSDDSMPTSVENLTTTVNKEDTSAIKSTNNDSRTLKNKQDNSRSDETESVEKIENKGKSNVFVYVSIVFVIISIGAIGYFVWDSNYKNINEEVSQEESTGSNIFTEEPEIVVNDNGIKEDGGSVEFSKKVNFLVIKPEELNKNDIESIINQRFLEMNDSGDDLLEFAVVDENNNPINFSDFSEAFEISFSDSINNQLNEEFYIYLYKNGIDERMGMVVKTNDINTLSDDVKKEENTLVKSVQSLFLGSVSDNDLNVEHIFNDSLYDIVAIRFTNLNNSSSTDYSIIEDNFMIATSKDSGRAIIDKILAGDDGASDMEVNEVGLGETETKDIFNETSENELESEGETMIEIE